MAGKTVGETLLTPTRIYVKAVLPLVKAFSYGIAHITGGGFIENLPQFMAMTCKQWSIKFVACFTIFDYLKN